MEDMSEAEPLRERIVNLLMDKAQQFRELPIPDQWNEEFQKEVNALRWNFVQELQRHMVDLELPPMNIVKPVFVDYEDEKGKARGH
jgi:hypothetical protein